MREEDWPLHPGKQPVFNVHMQEALLSNNASATLKSVNNSSYHMHIIDMNRTKSNMYVTENMLLYYCLHAAYRRPIAI